MPIDRRVFYIEEGSLAEALELEQAEFDSLVNFLQISEDDDARLKDSLHFVVQGYVNKREAIRIFSREGAISIANYLDLQGEITQSALSKVIALLERYRMNKIDGEIRQTVYENSSSLVLRRQRYWLSREDVRRIFFTSTLRFHKAFQDIQRSDSPMRVNQDYEDLENSTFFSLSGLEKLSIELSLSLRSRQRREYCARVGEVAPPVLEFLSLVPSPSQEEIDRAMNFAKNRDQSCQITGNVRSKSNRRIELVGHHLYDRNTYRFLSADPDNILTIDKLVHEDFHQWHGGYNQTCTVHDFIEYVEWRYPQKHEVILTLHNKQRILMIKLSQIQRSLPKGEP